MREWGSVPREHYDAFFANFIHLSVCGQNPLLGTWTYVSPYRAKTMMRPFENISDATGNWKSKKGWPIYYFTGNTHI